MLRRVTFSLESIFFWKVSIRFAYFLAISFCSLGKLAKSQSFAAEPQKLCTAVGSLPSWGAVGKSREKSIFRKLKIHLRIRSHEVGELLRLCGRMLWWWVTERQSSSWYSSQFGQNSGPCMTQCSSRVAIGHLLRGTASVPAENGRHGQVHVRRPWSIGFLASGCRRRRPFNMCCLTLWPQF